LCLISLATVTSTLGGSAIPQLGPFLSYCGDTDLNIASLYSLLSVENSVVSATSSVASAANSVAIIEASLCTVNNITSDCLTSTATQRTSTIPSFQSTTQYPPLSGGAIAGVAVGCTLAFVVIVGFLIFFFLRRRKQRRQRVIEQAEAANVQGAEKAQLHSEDLKPNRNELAGDQRLVLKRHVPVAEMPANEDPQWAMGEMPANEIAGSELEGKK
jgi:hypothetical protein